MKSGRLFGEVPGYPPGSLFANRRELFQAGVHRQLMAGISGGADEGADSVVVSGGYEDDEDSGDVIVYTGHGGNDPEAKRQIADQKFERGNRALARSADEGLPVRVIRGAGGDPVFSPKSGFRYDGLYQVERYWRDIGRAGFLIYRFRLVRLPDQPPIPSTTTALPLPEGTASPSRVQTTVQRVVRATNVSREVKELHHHQCQFCGTTVRTPAGPYAEGAHIRPLGRPHDGPDVAGNILCLCPNCHVRFDTGAVLVADDLRVLEAATGQSIGPLRTVLGHSIDRDALAYHRERFGFVEQA